MAEREGFEPSIPVSQYTRLAGERLRPTRPSLRKKTVQCSRFYVLRLKPRTLNIELRTGFLAEGVGFEPTELSFNGFQDRRLKPLGHPSAKCSADYFQPPHVWPQCLGDRDRPIGLLEIFQDSHDGSPYGQAGTVQGMDELGFGFIIFPEPD